MFVVTEKAMWVWDLISKPHLLHHYGSSICSMSNEGELYAVAKNEKILKFENNKFIKKWESNDKKLKLKCYGKNQIIIV